MSSCRQLPFASWREMIVGCFGRNPWKTGEGGSSTLKTSINGRACSSDTPICDTYTYCSSYCTYCVYCSFHLQNTKPGRLTSQRFKHPAAAAHGTLQMARTDALIMLSMLVMACGAVASRKLSEGVLRPASCVHARGHVPMCHAVYGKPHLYGPSKL